MNRGAYNEANESGYRATETIIVWRVMTFFKNGGTFEPELEYILNVSAVLSCVLIYRTESSDKLRQAQVSLDKLR